MSQSGKIRLRTLLYVLLIVAGIALIFFVGIWPSISNGVTDYADIDDHFKYGSIGSEPASGIPYWIWRALPVLPADKLPGKGYRSLGFIYEDGRIGPLDFRSAEYLSIASP